MDVQTVIAAAPLVKKAWKFTPAPLRVPLLIAGAAVVVWKFATDRKEREAVATSSATPQA